MNVSPGTLAYSYFCLGSMVAVRLWHGVAIRTHTLISFWNLQLKIIEDSEVETVQVFSGLHFRSIESSRETGGKIFRRLITLTGFFWFQLLLYSAYVTLAQ